MTDSLDHAALGHRMLDRALARQRRQAEVVRRRDDDEARAYQGEDVEPAFLESDGPIEPEVRG